MLKHVETAEATFARAVCHSESIMTCHDSHQIHLKRSPCKNLEIPPEGAAGAGGPGLTSEQSHHPKAVHKMPFVKKSGNTTTGRGRQHAFWRGKRETSSLQLVATSRCTKPRQVVPRNKSQPGSGPRRSNALDFRCLSRKFDSLRMSISSCLQAQYTGGGLAPRVQQHSISTASCSCNTSKI